MTSIRSIRKRGHIVVLACLVGALAGCGKVAEEYACIPTEDTGYREEMLCLRFLCTKQLVKVKRFTCTNGRDQWLKVEP